MGTYNYLVKKARKLTSEEVDNNCMYLIVGDTGSGKSSAGLTLGLMVDPYFYVDRIFFRPLPFMKKLEGGLPRSSVLMFDEAGEAVDSRKWYSDPNDVITSVIDTFRDDNLILIWCTPAPDRIDSRVRDMFDVVMDSLEPGKLQIKTPTTNRVSGRSYYPYPKTQKGNGKKITLKNPTDSYENVVFDHPKKACKFYNKPELYDLYMKKKRKFIKQDVYTEGRKRLEQKKEEADEASSSRVTSDQLLREIVENPTKYPVHNDGVSKRDARAIIKKKIENKYDDKDVQKSDVKEAFALAANDWDYVVQQYSPDEASAEE